MADRRTPAGICVIGSVVGKVGLGGSFPYWDILHPRSALSVI